MDPGSPGNTYPPQKGNHVPNRISTRYPYKVLTKHIHHAILGTVYKNLAEEDILEDNDVTIDRLQPGDTAPQVVVLDGTGEPLHLAHLWPNGPTLLTFLRHFG
jgi:hypothetical protein